MELDSVPCVIITDDLYTFNVVHVHQELEYLGITGTDRRMIEHEADRQLIILTSDFIIGGLHDNVVNRLFDFLGTISRPSLGSGIVKTQDAFLKLPGKLGSRTSVHEFRRYLHIEEIGRIHIILLKEIYLRV